MKKIRKIVNAVIICALLGVTPDISVAMDDEKTDNQLDTAINALG